MEGSSVPWQALARLHRPEWGLLAGGGLASFTIGATMPAFAFLFSKLYGVSLMSPPIIVFQQFIHLSSFEDRS